MRIRTYSRLLQASNGACITDTGAVGGRLLGMVTLSGQVLTVEGANLLTQSIQGCGHICHIVMLMSTSMSLVPPVSHVLDCMSLVEALCMLVDIQ